MFKLGGGCTRIKMCTEQYRNRAERVRRSSERGNQKQKTGENEMSKTNAKEGTGKHSSTPRGKTAIKVWSRGKKELQGPDQWGSGPQMKRGPDGRADKTGDLRTIKREPALLRSCTKKEVFKVPRSSKNWRERVLGRTVPAPTPCRDMDFPSLQKKTNPVRKIAPERMLTQGE